jgi:hypothetical protein
MSYLSAKKIYPGNWAEPLNGWYRNIDSNDDGTNNASNGGPTSVLATPGYRYFQQRGYVAVTNTSGAGAVAEASVIVPSPYRNDDTRTDITGMVVSGSSTLPAYGYRATISVASGWGDGRVASGVYAATGNVISFGRLNGSLPTAASGVGEGVIQANLASTTSGSQAGEIYFAGGSAAYSTVPLITASGAPGVTPGAVYKEMTAATTFKVFSKASANGVATAGGFYISSGDSAAGRVGYLVTEVCYIQPDEAPGYEDIEGYLTGRTVS